jgi:hypothetical protein
MSETITPATSVAIREPHYERVGLASLGASGGALAISNMAEAVSVAQLMARSGIAIRKHLRDQPGACLGVLMQAMRWEFDPYMVANKSYAVNDQLAYEAQLLAAVVLTRAAIVDEPDYTYDGEGPTRTCTVAFKMRSGKTLSYTTPQIGNIKTQNSPLWKSDPDQQLGYFAVRSWARRHQPHVLLGVYTVEEAQEVIDITPGTSGVASRLPGAQNGAGFSHEGVQAEGERAAPKAARASRKPKAPDVVEEPVSEEAPGPEAQIEQAKEAGELVGIRPQPDASADAKSETSSTTSEEHTLDGDAKPAETVEVITEGYPAENEVYMLNGDGWEFNAQHGEERRDTYKNGEPFSDAGRDKGYLIYEDHAPAGQAAPEIEAEEVTEEAVPPELSALIDATEGADSWDAVKVALGTFQKGTLWPTLSPEQQNHMRASTWETLVDRSTAEGIQISWLPDPAHDISAFRLWVEAQDDAGAIKAELALLQADEAAQAKTAALASVTAAAQARLQALEA